MKEHFRIKNDSVYYKDLLLSKISAVDFEIVYQLSGFHISYFDRGYLKDKKGIWWFHEGKNKPKLVFITADIAHFSVINNDYAKDSNTVYWQRTNAVALPNSDPESFQVINDTHYFSKDKNQLYALSSSGEGLIIFDEIAIDTVCFFDENKITDKDHLYYFNWHFIEYGNRSKYIHELGKIKDQKFPVGDPVAIFEYNKKALQMQFPELKGWWHSEYPFKIREKELLTPGFLIADTAVHFLEKDSSDEFMIPNLVRGAEPTSFEQLNHFYGKDKQAVFYKWHTLKNVDIASFEALDHRFAKDQYHYFFDGKKIEAADYSSFKIPNTANAHTLEHAIDDHYLFVNSSKRLGKFKGYGDVMTPIKNSDPATFTLYDKGWAKDKNQVYYNFSVLKKADASSFEYLFDIWAKDKLFLYQRGSIVKNINGGSFKVLNDYWGTDSKQVYNFKTFRKYPSIDAASFTVIDDKGRAKDKNYDYWMDDGYYLKKKKL